MLGSQRCDCGPQLREAVERIADAGGYLLYLRQEGRGIGLYAKLDAYALQDAGLDTYEANLALGYAEDERDYTVAAQMLAALGVERVALLSNNPDKAAQPDPARDRGDRGGPTAMHLSPDNRRYLAAKARRAANVADILLGWVAARPGCGHDGQMERRLPQAHDLAPLLQFRKPVLDPAKTAPGARRSRSTTCAGSRSGGRRRRRSTTPTAPPRRR